MSSRVININPHQRNKKDAITDFLKLIENDEDIHGLVAIAEKKDGSFLYARSRSSFAMAGCMDLIKSYMLKSLDVEGEDE